MRVSNGTIFSSVSTPSSAVGRAPFNEWMEEQRASRTHVTSIDLLPGAMLKNRDGRWVVLSHRKTPPTVTVGGKTFYPGWWLSSPAGSGLADHVIDGDYGWQVDS